MFSRVRWELDSIIGRCLITGAGVAVGKSLRLYGLPIVTLAPGTTIKIGDNCTLVSAPRGTHLGVRAPTIIRTLNRGACVSLGNDVGISGAVICAASEVTIGDRTLLGADVMIFDTDFHNLDPGSRQAAPIWRNISRPIRIEQDVFVGTKSIIAKGVTIGRGSIVGAGSVVTKDIPSFTVVAGAPARIIKSLI